VSIPNDRGPAVDAVLALDLGIESREAAEIVVDRVADILRYAPMGDNHHNAAACPYCSPRRPPHSSLVDEEGEL
jgi:hypothetical protein